MCLYCMLVWRVVVLGLSATWPCSSEEVTFICIDLSEETECVNISIICLRGVVIV